MAKAISKKYIQYDEKKTVTSLLDMQSKGEHVGNKICYSSLQLYIPHNNIFHFAYNIKEKRGMHNLGH